MKKTYLTPEGMERVKEELEHVKTVALPGAERTAAELLERGALGMAYKDAVEKRIFYKERIGVLTNMIETAEIIEPKGTCSCR